MNASIVIAVEKYADKKAAGIRYAAADARDFAAALEPHGFGPASRELLIDGDATKTAVESAVRTTLRRLQADDTLFVYFNGHGFASGADGHLACHDVRTDDCEPTSVSLDWLLRQFESSACERIALFLDASDRGLFAGRSAPGDYGAWNDEPLETSFRGSRRRVCFTACAAGEQSLVSGAWKHGVWTHHLIQAFAGASAAVRSGRLTASSLTDYLSVAVPAALRTLQPDAVQTPRTFGGDDDFRLADFQELVAPLAPATPAKRKAKADLGGGQIKDVTLSGAASAGVKSLSGFVKGRGHFPPDRRGGGAQRFISAIAAADIQADVDRVAAALKLAFRLKRLQLDVQNTGDGVATVTTPFFNYNVAVEQDPLDPSQVVWRRSITEIVATEKLLTAEFETVFRGVFDTVELTLHEDLDVPDFVDRIEALDNDAIQIDYAAQTSTCELRIRGVTGLIQVSARTFTIVHRRAAAPKRMLESLLQLRRFLEERRDVLALPWR